MQARCVIMHERSEHTLFFSSTKPSACTQTNPVARHANSPIIGAQIDKYAGEKIISKGNKSQNQEGND
jgi:hypothetical protein